MNVPVRPPAVLQRLWMPQGMALGTGAMTISKPMPAWIALLLGLALVGCGGPPSPSGAGPCATGNSSCAAAAAAPGQRQVGCGHRIVRVRWIERTNKESGVPDIGIQADWAAITERR
jgi:hypothetical protein